MLPPRLPPLSSHLCSCGLFPSSFLERSTTRPFALDSVFTKDFTATHLATRSYLSCVCRNGCTVTEVYVFFPGKNSWRYSCSSISNH